MATGIISDSIQNARTLKLAHTAAVTAGDIIVSGAKILIAVATALINELNSYVYEGKVIMPKAAGVAFIPGAKCYWDAVANNITSVSVGNTLCGFATEDAALADTTVCMMLRQYNTEVNDADAQAAASTADSKAVSNSTVMSTNKSLSDSKAASNSVIASTNLSTGDSKAASNSTLISTADSKVGSNGVVDSTNKSIADSKSASLNLEASTNLSTGDSKATSNSTLISTADSKGVSAAVQASTADSKAVSNSVIESTNLSSGSSRATSNSVIASTNLSTGDSKAASLSVLISTANSKMASYHA